MSDLLTWRGRSGRTYEFRLDVRGLQYEPTPGVYLFCKRLPDGRWEGVEVGAAKVLQDTLNPRGGVLGWNGIVERGATHIATLAVPWNEAEAIAVDLV